ncbi:MAG: ABC transporter substrate-binding protein [Anaerolineae bacterium]|nr:ABC transporter substrate-binding protein [Phycisphaerae bacterium]
MLRILICLRLALIIAIACLISCDRAESSNTPRPVELRFWNGFTGPDGRTMLAIVKQFNAANPDVHVMMQRMEWGTYYNKLFVAALGKRAPEVFVIHTDSIPRFRSAGFLRESDDIAIDSRDFDENVWRAVEFDGKHYAIPLDVHLLGMFYNRTLFKEAGIEKPPTSRAEFLDACKRLTKENQWGFVFTWQRTNIYTLFRQWGGDIFSPDGTHCTIDLPACVAALQFAVDLIYKLKVTPSPAAINAFIGFRQGKVGMVFEGIYMLPELKRQTDLDWGAAPVPQLGAQPAAWCNSHNLCVRSDLTGRELEAAQRFVKYLSDHSLDWAEGGQVPVRKSLRNSERFQSMTAQREFAKQIPHAAYMPRVAFVNEYLAEYEPAIEKALYGSAPPQEALSAARQRIERIMQRFNPSSSAQAGAR